MKTLLKFIFAFLFTFLLTAQISTAFAQDDDAQFNEIRHAFRYWLKQPDNLIETKSIGRSDFRNYKNLAQISFDRFLTNPNGEWKIHRIASYDFSGNEAPTSFMEMSLDNAGTKKQILREGYYYIHKGDAATGPRLILGISSKYENVIPYEFRIVDYGTIYFDKASEALAREFNKQLDAYLLPENIYNGGILELAEDGRIQFLSNMESLDPVKWDELILDNKLKALSFEQTERFVRLHETLKGLNLKTKKGVLLAGPPGTGKSLLGQIMISSILHGELKKKATFISVTARNLVFKSAIRSLFQEAARLSPTVIFMEDMDLLGVKSRGDEYSATKDEILNEFLNGIDGAVDNDGILVVGTTNKPGDVDSALLRSQRLGVHLYFGLPGFEERVQFFEKFGKKRAVWEAGITSQGLAAQSEKLSGADIVELIRFAKQFAYEENSYDSPGILLLKKTHFDKAFDKIRQSGGDASSVKHQDLAKSLKALRQLEAQIK